MAPAGPVLRLRDVRYRWPGPAAFGLHVADFEMARGETVLLLGESGSGKSTLLSLICGTIVAQSGLVEVDQKDLGGLGAGGRDTFRADRIGVIFQQFNLLPFGTVAQNIRLPLSFAPARRARVPDPMAEAGRLCAELGLEPGVLSRSAGQLSVGQQQRVAAARALIGQPPLIIADEPTSALDAGTQSAFLDLLFRQTRAHDASLLMVSHDDRLAKHFDRVMQIDEIAAIDKAAA